MIGAGATLKGLTTTACCRAGSSVGRLRILRGRPIVLIRAANKTMAVMTSGAIRIDRFSHNSRRTDQYIGRVAVRGRDAVRCASMGKSCTLVIDLLLLRDFRGRPRT